MLVSAVKFSRKIIENEPLKSFAKPKAYDPPEDVLMGSDEVIREWCRKTVQRVSGLAFLKQFAILMVL